MSGGRAPGERAAYEGAAPLAVFALALAVTCALFWPLPVALRGAYAPSAFGASHAWVFDHLWRGVSGETALHETARAGYPWIRQARFIGWAPAALSWPLRPLLGPLGAAWAVLLLSPALSALAAWPLLRRWTGAGALACGAGCLVYGLSPFALSTAAIGEIPKQALWCFPLFLLALERALTADRPLRWLAALAALGPLTSFTSPYFGLALPLLAVAGAGGWLAARLTARGAAAGVSPRRLALARAGLTLAAVALSLVPALLYYQGAAAADARQLFLPALKIDALTRPYPVATLYGLFFGDDSPWRGPWPARHLAYLGLPLLLGLAALTLAGRGRPGGGAHARAVGIALLVGGAVLALGPWLAARDAYTAIPLPALLLDAAGYPYARGGMYFRLIALSWLGAALWLASEGARRPRLAAALAALVVGDSVRASGPWPRPVEPVPAIAYLEQMSGGAALHLPMQEATALAVGQRALLMATAHGLYASAMPRDLLKLEISDSRAWWGRALLTARPAVTLRARGVRYVIEDQAVELPRVPPAWLPPSPDWTGGLGEPAFEGDGVRIWAFEETEVEPIPR